MKDQTVQHLQVTDSDTTNTKSSTSKDPTSLNTSVPKDPDQFSSANNMASAEKELATLTKKAESLPAGSMERLFIDMTISMKKDNLKELDKLQDMDHRYATMQTEISGLKKDKTDFANSLTFLQGSQETDAATLQATSKTLQEVCDKVEILQGIVERQSQMIQHLQNYNDQSEVKQKRNNLLISGIIEEERESNEQTKDVVKNFFSQVMKISKSIEIKSTERLGKVDSTQPHSIKVVLSTVKDKGIIYKHAKNLKDVKNANGKPYFINDHLPLAVQEEKR